MHTDIQPRLVVEPAVAMIDVPRQIDLVNFAPDERVMVTATLLQNDGSTWRSETVFVVLACASGGTAEGAGRG